MVWQFIEVFKKIARTGVHDDDFADRLSHRYTVVVLLIFCILVGSTQFVGCPIACWAPAQFTGSMVTYTNYICWIKNTYYVPSEESLPNPNLPREYRVNYYQWVPFILALMALMFCIPNTIWHVFSQQHCVHAKTVMKIITNMDASNTDAREKSIRTICKIIDRSIDINRDWNDITFFARLRRWLNRCFLPINKSNGAYICTLYMIVKGLYIINVCGQFFLLNSFMGPNYNLYGFQVIHDLWVGKDFWESSRFPRVTMCDFSIRTLGENNQANTIQCTLPINLFNEKIFMFIWFWLCIVAAISVYSFIVWSLCNLSSSSRTQFIRRYLRFNERFHHRSSGNVIETKMFELFVFEYLRQDGLFLLRIVKKNANDLVVGELITALWDQFKRSPRYLQNDDSMHKDNEKLIGMNGGESLLPNGYHHNP